VLEKSGEVLALIRIISIFSLMAIRRFLSAHIRRRFHFPAEYNVLPSFLSGGIGGLFGLRAFELDLLSARSFRSLTLPAPKQSSSLIVHVLNLLLRGALLPAFYSG
jgi:hypothetical protein